MLPHEYFVKIYESYKQNIEANKKSAKIITAEILNIPLESRFDKNIFHVLQAQTEAAYEVARHDYERFGVEHSAKSERIQKALQVLRSKVEIAKSKSMVCKERWEKNAYRKCLTRASSQNISPSLKEI